MEYAKGCPTDKTLPNCGIVAISSATETTYDYVYNWFKQTEKRPNQWKGATYSHNYLSALKACGATNSKEVFNARGEKKKPIPLKYLVRMMDRKYPGAKFVVCSCNHTMAIHNGIVLDQSGILPVNEHKSKGRRITNAWIVQ